MTTAPLHDPALADEDCRFATCVEGWADVRDGGAAMLPWLIGVVPFGLLVGATGAEAGISPAVVFAFAASIYSGSAQLLAAEGIADGAGLVAATIPVLVLNARLLLYGSSIAPNWRRTSWPFRTLAAYLMVDPSYAVGMDGYGKRRGHGYYVGGGVVLWVAWMIAIAVGMMVGSAVPPELRLEWAVPLFLLAETVRVARGRPAVAAALASAAVAVPAGMLPLHIGLLVAVITGAAVGVGFEEPDDLALDEAVEDRLMEVGS